MYVILIILLLLSVDIQAQNSNIEIKVLNDTIYFHYNNIVEPIDTPYVPIDTNKYAVIDELLEVEIINNTNYNYFMYLDTSKIWIHHYRPYSISDSLRYDHGCNLITLLYNSKFKRQDSGGAFVMWEKDFTPDHDRDYLELIEYYKSNKIKIDKDKIFDNYNLNKNRFYLKRGQKKVVRIPFKIPFYTDNYYNYFDLSKNEHYFIDFYFHNKCVKIKESLTKNELKALKKDNYQIFGGTIHTKKKIPLLYKQM